MGAVSSTTLGDLRRRRVQTIVLAAILALASGAATVALDILAASHEPFEQAFARANGAHLVIDYAPTVTAAQLAATATADHVTATAGPWPVVRGAMRHPFGGFVEDEFSGRARPDESVDAITISAGRWWAHAGEAVLDREAAERMGLTIGGTLELFVATTSATGTPGKGGGPIAVRPGKPAAEPDPQPVATVTIVGLARSVSTPDTTVWLSPEELVRLVRGGQPANQMLYRVDPAGGDADLAAATRAIASDLPPDAMLATRTSLELRAGVDDVADLYVPILLAFSAFALAAAAFTIANIVGGIVLTGYRDIGVMKAIGFAPLEVTGILLAQILVPVAVGALVGTAAGVAASAPTVERLERSFGLPGSFTASLPVVIGVPLLGIAISMLAALVPAIRAGRLSVVEAMARGASPSRRPDGGVVRRASLRLPLALPLRLGVASGAAHPLRAAMTLGALVVGVAAATFAVGLDLSLLRIIPQLDRLLASPVRAQVADPAVDRHAVSEAIAAYAGTDRWVAIGQAHVTARGLGTLPLIGYDGATDWLGYELIRGRWFSGPAEVVAPTHVFTVTGLRIGDTLDVVGPGGTVTVTLVGETFEGREGSPANLLLRGSWATLVAADPQVLVSAWEVRPAAGTTPREVAQWVRESSAGQVEAYTLDDSSSDEEFVLFLSVVASMGAVLVAIALGGVFGTVALETRRRTRELAVLRSLGLAPAQVVLLVIAGVVPLGLLAGLLGLPLGLAFQRAVLGHLGATAGKTGIPDSAYDVFGPILLAGLALAGLAIAAAGAWVPARRAARERIAPILLAD